MKNQLRCFTLVTLMMAGSLLQAQVYKTSTGTVSFHSHTKVEDIDATNSSVTAALSTASGDIQFSLSVNSFQFKKELMKTHFNENYMESTKFPKASFKGKIEDNSKVNYTKDGSYTVSVKGKLTMHGVTKEVTIPGTITVKGGKITLATKGTDFKVKPADYGVKREEAYKTKIADEIEITVNCELTKKS